MAIIDSKSDSKFDALIRINKDDTLMAFIMATYNACDSENKKEDIIFRLKSAYELYRGNIRGKSGAGTYGEDIEKIKGQFESHYTMGYEMGIWKDSEYTLNHLAVMVAEYKITVAQYIGIVFLNLFTYYSEQGTEKYHHFLYEILKEAKSQGIIDSNMPKELIFNKIKIDKESEQRNILFNYLIASDLFEEVDKNHFALSDKWKNNHQMLLGMCNLEYREIDILKGKEMAKDKAKYAAYITKNKDVFGTENSQKNYNNSCHKNGGLKGENLLLYGVPGCGKSHYVENVLGVTSLNSKRVVFHPDYTYSDLVGQIKPVVKNKYEILLECQNGNDYSVEIDVNQKIEMETDKVISYEFIPGPLIEILSDCYNKPEEMHFLVIEEINRGNAPAIFGEIFQLLDRDVNGISEYGVYNSDIGKSVAELLVKQGIKVPIEIKENIIRIPANLTIVATMNTSDQNVFALDTAFKRRWQMKAIRNNFDAANMSQYKELEQDIQDKIRNGLEEQINTKLCGTNITWGDFATRINRVIVDSTGNGDKRLGHFFIKGEEMIDPNKFSEKVLMYLWHDVFRYGGSEIFKYSTLDEVLEKFELEKFNIFSFTFPSQNIGQEESDDLSDNVLMDNLAEDETGDTDG